MTRNISSKERTVGIGTGWLRGALSLLAVAVVMIAIPLYSERISHSVRSALELLYRVVIPAVFPFMIIADLMYALLDFSSLKLAGKIFERAFGISRSGIYPLILGATCGFPLGVKCTADLYRNGRITGDEAERLIGFCNNTGPAFLIAGVGIGLRGSISDGITLYISMMLAAIAIGIAFSIGHGDISCEDRFPRERFSITASIRSAGTATLTLSSFVAFFAIFAGMLRLLLGESIPYLCLISFLEIGSATSIFSKTKLLTSFGSLVLTAFATGFSGLSVHLQALSFLEGTGLSCRRYFIMKLLQGILTAIFCAIIYVFTHG